MLIENTDFEKVLLIEKVLQFCGVIHKYCRSRLVVREFWKNKDFFKQLFFFFWTI